MEHRKYCRQSAGTFFTGYSYVSTKNKHNKEEAAAGDRFQRFDSSNAGIILREDIIQHWVVGVGGSH